MVLLRSEYLGSRQRTAGRENESLHVRVMRIDAGMQSISLGGSGWSRAGIHMRVKMHLCFNENTVWVSEASISHGKQESAIILIVGPKAIIHFRKRITSHRIASPF